MNDATVPFASKAPESGSPSSTGPPAATILIVDDEIQNRKLLEALLQPEGYLTLSCSTGEQALALIAQRAPDLVLLDVMMPGMDGYQVAGELKANPATANIPIIMLTALVDRSARLAGLKAGAEEFLTKPVERAELWLRVRNLLRLKSLGDLLQNHNAILEREVLARTESLRASESRFRQLAENIRDVFFLIDADSGSMLYISPAYEEIWGRSCESVYANPESWTEAFHPDDRASTYEKYRQGMLSGAFELEYRIVRPDGSLRWLESRSFPVRDDGGRIVRIAGIAVDITGRKQSERELHESRQRLDGILTSAMDAIVTVDEDKRIVLANPAAERMFGYVSSELNGLPLDLLIPERSRAGHSAHITAFGKADVTSRPMSALRPVSGLRKNGEEFPIEASISKDQSTGRWFFTSILRDITERIRNEERIRRLNRIYAVLSGINSLIVRARDRAELLSESCRIAVEQGNFGIAWIGLLDPQTQDVTPVAWAGANAEKIVDVMRSARDNTPAGQGSVGQAIRARRAVVISDNTVLDPRGPRVKEIQELGFRSHITLPLLESQAVVGTLTLYSTEQNYFDAAEVRLLTELSGDISFALDNISRQQKLDKLSRIRAVSGEINAAIVRIREREALLKAACRIVSEHGKFEMIWIAAIDRARREVQPVAWTGFSEETAHAVKWSGIGATRGPIGEAIQNRKPSVRTDVEGELSGGTLRQEALKRGYRSSLCLPLVVDDKVTALIVLFAAGEGFFDKDELALLEAVASDLSFALQAIERQEKLDYLAYYDPLTGLANRNLFLERVTQYIRSAASGGHKLALYLIDLERFKNINDTLGQAAGDALLQQVAEWLTRNVGDVNLLARVGADHFAMVLPEVKQAEEVARLLEKTIDGFLAHEFRLNDAVFRVAAKVGVALFPDDGADADTLFRHTEAALKKAKASGERYLFFTQKMTAMVAGRLTLENQLRQALDNEEFVLHYQPKVSLSSGKVAGAEALLRWNDPRTGLLPPGQFIPILEETGLIYPVGRWALRKAIEDYLRWRNAGLPAVRVAVNVSPLQLRSRIFSDEVTQVLSIDGRAAAGLELEITESLIMEDVEHTIASLQTLRELGISIAIDDFGTGFSSLSYLAKLPVDTLKIDRAFVVDMTAGPEGLALVSTIINLAHSLKLKVVAEGVETDEQSRLLRLLNCDEMQGFLFCKPVPAEIFEATYLAPSPAGNLTLDPPPAVQPECIAVLRGSRE